MRGRLSWRWRARELALEPAAVVGTGAAAVALARRALARDEDALASLSGVASIDGAPRALVLIGDRDALPWAPGVVYAGRDESSPGYLWPTAWRLDVPLPLAARAIASPPAVIVPHDPPNGGGAWISIADARAVSRRRLEVWLAGGER